jgi:gliding motility-associated-like protein
MKYKKILFIISLAFTLFSSSSFATHLMGGSISYTYLGITSGQYQYKVTLDLFRLCEPGSSTLPFDMSLGVYQDDLSSTLGNKTLLVSTSLSLTFQQFVTPPAVDTSCSFSSAACVEEGIYEVFVLLPANTTGYYFIADRCCRNNNIINLDLPGSTGETYIAVAPAPSIVNNSPEFVIDPVPYICANDTISILNQAIDPDGDILVYSFITPYAGVSTDVNPAPLPQATYFWPIPNVNYAPGYSFSNPFGAGGFASMNSSTGLASYFVPNQGFYVIAVEVQEFRNGVLIGTTRRDIQIIVLPCPNNPAPTLSSSTSQVNFNIQEGENLCFDVTFLDSNGDSTIVNHTGAIFDGSITNPPATFTNNTGVGSVTNQFCWTPSCNNGGTIPYQFTISALDLGCPPKITNVVYTINVQNTIPPAGIIGPDTLCFNDKNNVNYSITPSPGNTYSWSISNGTFNGANIGNNVSVNFNNAGSATISVSAISANGCFSSSLTKTVIIKPNVNVFAGDDKNYCSGSQTTIGAAGIPGYTYQWSPSNGLNNPNASQTTVNLTNTGNTPLVQDYILTATFNGCINTDTVKVTVNPLPAQLAGNDTSICSGTTITIGANPIPNFTYAWTPTIGLNNATLANPSLTLLNLINVPVIHMYLLTVTTQQLCTTNDTVYITVNKLPNANAGIDKIICSGDSINIGTNSSVGSTYQWNPSAGLSNPNISNPVASGINNLAQNDTINYVLTVSQSTCVAKDSMLLIIKPKAIADAGPDQLLCSGNTIQLGNTAVIGTSYVWSPTTGLSNSNISNPSLSLTNTGALPDTLIYVLTSTLNGCVAKDTVKIILSPVPVAQAGSDIIFCNGNNLSIGSNSISNYQYQWSPSNGLSNNTISNPVVVATNISNVQDTLNYILSVNLFGCFDTDTVEVIIKPNPISFAGNDATMCGGDTITIGTASTNNYNYQWLPTTGLNNSTISNPQFTISNNGPTVFNLLYEVATTLNGCTVVDSINITVNPLPTITAVANPSIICFGDTSNLIATGGSTYNWANSASPAIITSTDSSYLVHPTITTSYILIGTNSLLCSNSDTVSITVNPLPIVTASAANDSICSGDTITLNASGAISYQWNTLNGTNIGTGATFQVSPTTDTTFVVIGTDLNLCSNSDTITIITNPLPTLTSITGTLSVCPGVTGVYYWVNDANASSTYQWVITNGTLISGQGTDSITVDWSVNSGIGSITVQEFTAFGCTALPIYQPININILLTPAAPFGTSTLCANTAQGISYATLNTNGSTYNWFANGGTIISGNGSNNVIVNWNSSPAGLSAALWYEETSVTAVDTCFGISDTLYITINPIPNTSSISGVINACVFDSSNFSVTNTINSTYNWTIQNGTILSGNGTSIINVNWPTSGPSIINVTETNQYSCVGDTITIQTEVHPLPTANAGTDVSICIGKTTTLNASGGVIFEWTQNATLSNLTISNPIASPTVETTYYVMVTDTNSCKNIDSVTVSVNALPTITLTPNSSICIGKTIQLDASGGVNYQWFGNSLNSNNIPNPIANPIQTSIYTVIVTDQNLCVDSAKVTITVNLLPIINAGLDTIICAGSSVLLNASGGVSYNWLPSSSLNNAGISSPIASPSSTTTYAVTGTDANGCSNIDAVVVNINEVPKASFTINEEDLKNIDCNGYEGKITNTTIDGLDYIWNFSDGTSSNEINPNVNFSLTGNNTVTLIATNNICSDTTKQDFISSIVKQIFENMPNVITPNGDNVNDCFELGDNINLAACSNWTIMNRWGEEVFKNSADQPCWNGKKNNTGADLNAGTYFIIVTVGDEEYKGIITLLK